MTNNDLRSIDIGLASLRRQNARPKMAFRVAHTINQLMPSFDALSKQEEAIRAKYLVLDDKKQPTRDPAGEPVIRDGFTRKEFDDAFTELFEMDAEVTLPRTRFKAKDFEDSNMLASADILLLLGELVVFEDEDSTPTPERK